MPAWLVQAHEMYRLGQACPWWRPPDETSGLIILAMAEVHSIYEELRLQQQARMFGAG